MTWKDGLAAAIKILSERHELRFWTLGKQHAMLPHEYFPITVVPDSVQLKLSVSNFCPDVILHWADCTRPNAPVLAELGKPMALCFAGGNPEAENYIYFDHIFVESEVYKQKFEEMEVSVSTAFGTNTELFKPIPGQAKQFDVIFPATYCDWKRHKLFNEATRGLKTVTAGYMYEVQERDCWEDVMKAGTLTLPHVSAEVLRHLYAASEACLITSQASGGSQRTVLEAMSMNLPVVVTDDGKCAEYVLDCGSGHVAEPNAESIRQQLESALMGVSTVFDANRRAFPGPRDYVLSKWSEHHYADALEAGLTKILK
jgi:glycosyltransferase involved in cell wall biosynthesis